MEQVAGDFFFGLESFTDDYGGFAILPYAFGVIWSMFENFTHDRRKRMLREELEGNAKRIFDFEPFVYAADTAYAYFFRPDVIPTLTAADAAEKQRILDECNRLSSILEGFQEERYRLLAMDAQASEQHAQRTTTIAKTTCALTLGGVVFIVVARGVLRLAFSAAKTSILGGP